MVLNIPMVVDFPAPLGPRRPNASPGATSKLMLFTRLDVTRVGLGEVNGLDGQCSRVHGAPYLLPGRPAGGSMSSM